MTKKKNLADPFPESREPIGNRFTFLREATEQKDETTFKVLLSKLLYTEESFSEEETVQLFQARERMMEKCAKHDDYKRKFFFQLFLFRGIFVNLSAFVIDLHSRKQFAETVEGFYTNGRRFLSASQYYGSKLAGRVSMQWSQPTKPKERNRIGVGYRDKGTARNSAWDGSPPWQEVATDEWFQSHNITKSFSDALEWLYHCFRTKEVYPWQSKTAIKQKSHLVKEMRN